MTRKNFAQILEEASVDFEREYRRLYFLFYKDKIESGYTFRQYCEIDFSNMSFQGRCLSLQDFDDTYNFHFIENPSKIDLNDLIIFCEYIFNLIKQCQWNKHTTIKHYGSYASSIKTALDILLSQIFKVIDILNYHFYKKENGIFILVPKDTAAIAVAKIMDDDLSYRVIEYNHHILKGNIKQKRFILLQLATKLEHQRNELKQINKSLEDNLFFLFNNLNIRHDNVTAEDNKNYKETVAKMSSEDLESWYDETYQLCLLAFLELDNVERKQKIEELKKKIKT